MTINTNLGKITIPKKIQILNITFDVILDKNSSGGAFCLSNEEATITIGSKEKLPQMIFEIFLHEVSEVTHALLNTRYSDGSVHGNWKFFLDHKEFQNHNAIVSGVLSNLFKIK
jgi:hypothetical protein